MVIYGILDLNHLIVQDYIGILRLADCAIVTSGNYERYFIGEDKSKRIFGHNFRWKNR